MDEMRCVRMRCQMSMRRGNGMRCGNEAVESRWLQRY